MRITHITRTLTAVGLVAAAGATLSPLAVGTPTRAAGVAYLRVLHAVPDAPAVEVFVNGKKAVASLAYGKQTAFVPVPAAALHIQVFAAGTPYARGGGLINVTAPFKAGAYATVAAIGTLKTIVPAVLMDQKMTMTKAEVRFVHFASTAPAVDIAVAGGPVLFKDVSYKTVGMYAPVAAGTYNLQVRVAGTKTVALAVPGVALKAGHIYTIYALGLLKGTGMQALSALASDDTPMMASSKM